MTETMGHSNAHVRSHYRGAGEEVRWIGNIPFLVVHAACLMVLWTGWSPIALLMAFVTLAARMFGLTGGYHRYFSHRSFQTSRFFQFVLAWLGCAAAQMGPLWWAAHHRHHHRHSDTEHDVHPPGVKGFFWAHMGWIMSPTNQETRLDLVPDLTTYPELRWLNRFHYVAPISLAVLLWLLGDALATYAPALGTSGWQMLAWAFFVSTTALYHITFAVNSFGHVFGSRRYDTDDDSRNNWIVALLAGGEGWHNNHHRYPGSARQGFYWWEIDMTHYGLQLLALVGIVWDVRAPSKAVLQEGQR